MLRRFWIKSITVSDSPLRPLRLRVLCVSLVFPEMRSWKGAGDV